MPKIRLTDLEVRQLLGLCERELKSATVYLDHLKLALSKLSLNIQPKPVSPLLPVTKPADNQAKKRGRPKKSLSAPLMILPEPLVPVIEEIKEGEEEPKMAPHAKQKKKKRGFNKYPQRGMIFLKPMAKPLPKPKADDPFITEANRKWL